MITLNEQRAIAKVVNEIKAVVPDAEILVVDSSTDETAEIARSLGCRVIEQNPPRGYGPAMDTALRSASGDIVVTLDCDDTYPPEAIPDLVRLIEQGQDIAAASRMRGKPDAMPLPNYLANLVFNAAAHFLCGVQSTDLHTGMRAYRKTLLQSFAYDPQGMALPVELLVGPVRLGYKYCEIFIDYRPRIGETTLRPLEGTLWTFKRIWKWRKWKKMPDTSIASSPISSDP
jgi:glycosyltransferase involved in cell wall biosynthesis